MGRECPLSITYLRLAIQMCVPVPVGRPEPGIARKVMLHHQLQLLRQSRYFVTELILARNFFIVYMRILYP